MASTPSFAVTMKIGSVKMTTFTTSLTAPSPVATIVTGASTGTKVEELVIQGLGTTAAGVANLFLYDGTTYFLFDQVLVVAVTSNTTSIAWRARRQYQNLLLPSTSWSLRGSHTTTGNDNLLNVTAFGADL